MVKRLYTDKDILAALAEGLSRKEIAKRYGHIDIRTIDNYMRSQGYCWHKPSESYRKLRTTTNGFNSSIETKEKVIEIIECFSKGMESKEIAKRFAFSNTRELATYMKKQGFEWNTEQLNYVPKSITSEVEPILKTDTATTLETLNSVELDFLQELLTYRDVLLPMLRVKKSLTPAFPFYQLQGITHSKSVQITTSLDELIRTFCREKKMSQKQVFEIALIEFLQKYGYEHELSTILQFNNGTFSLTH